MFTWLAVNRPAKPQGMCPFCPPPKKKNSPTVTYYSGVLRTASISFARFYKTASKLSRAAYKSLGGGSFNIGVASLRGAGLWYFNEKHVFVGTSVYLRENSAKIDELAANRTGIKEQTTNLKLDKNNLLNRVKKKL
jgi:hypothetical protein